MLDISRKVTAVAAILQSFCISYLEHWDGLAAAASDRALIRKLRIPTASFRTTGEVSFVFALGIS